MSRRRLYPAASAVVLAALAAALIARSSSATPNRFAARLVVSDRADRNLVNAWGLAALPTGPWWVSNEASDTSTLYNGSGRKQLLTVAVPGGPTGIAAYGGKQFVVHGGGRSDPARFVYACEDGRIRAWTPTVPTSWSNRAVIAVDDAGEAAIFRGVAFANGRLYATDFHNARVDVFNGKWQRIHLAGSFADPDVPTGYAPDNIAILGGRVFVTYVYRAPVDGNDAPTGGYVDEFDLEGNQLARVASGDTLSEPYGLALAPKSFGPFRGDLLVANFGNGQIAAFRRDGDGWRPHGVLAGADGNPLVVDGVWGIAFGNGAFAGPVSTLYAAAGPHRWHGASELAVHGRITAIKPS